MTKILKVNITLLRKYKKKIQTSIQNQQQNPLRFKKFRFQIILKNSEHLREVDGVDVAAQSQCDVDQTEKESQVAQHSVLPVQPLLRVSSVVSVGVRKPGSYEDKPAQR